MHSLLEVALINVQVAQSLGTNVYGFATSVAATLPQYVTAVANGFSSAVTVVQGIGLNITAY